MLLISDSICLIVNFYYFYYVYSELLFLHFIFLKFLMREWINLTYILTLTFLVPKMGLVTLLASLVSILRAKSWKVVMKCKSCMFNFGDLFLKMYIFEVVKFLLTSCLSNRFNFSVVVHMIHVFDEAFFFLTTVAMITDSVTFSSFHNVRETNSLITIMQVINPNYP